MVNNAVAPLVPPPPNPAMAHPADPFPDYPPAEAHVCGKRLWAHRRDGQGWACYVCERAAAARWRLAMSITDEETRHVLSALLEHLSGGGRGQRLARQIGVREEDLAGALRALEARPPTRDAQALRTLTKLSDRLRLADTTVLEYAGLAPAQLIVSVQGFTLDEIMRANVAKLRARYPDGFDPERSRNRTNETGETDEETHQERHQDALQEGEPRGTGD